jgi:hypothetical protein
MGWSTGIVCNLGARLSIVNAFPDARAWGQAETPGGTVTNQYLHEAIKMKRTTEPKQKIGEAQSKDRSEARCGVDHYLRPDDEERRQTFLSKKEGRLKLSCN